MLSLVIFFDFNAFGGSRIPRGTVSPEPRPTPHPPKTMVFSLRFGRDLASRRVPPLVGASGAPKINIFWPRSTKNQYFLFPDTKNQYSFPGAPKINIFCPRTTKNQYFVSRSTKSQYCLSPEHQTSIFSVPRPRKINIFCSQTTKNQNFLFPDH